MSTEYANSPLADSLVLMRRERLANLPPVQIPPEYELRVFQPKDEVAWEDILADAFEDDRRGFFDKEMRQDQNYFNPDSILMIWKQDRPVATASAWLRNRYGPEVGYLHWVAVLNSERGKDLGYQISLAAMHKMVADGRKSCALATQVRRIPAIKTYLKLGFEPWVLEEEQREHWDEVWRLMAPTSG